MRFHLDHNATTAVDARVLDCFVAIESAHPANPASLHTAGRAARAIVEDSRQRIAEALRVDVGDVLFTSGGTEANNLAVAGLGDPDLPVLLAEVEHPSVREVACRRGARWLGTDREGRAVVADVDERIGLLCMVHGQSEVGTLQPVGAAAALAHSLGVSMHVDAAQTLGRVGLDEVLAVAGSVTLSPHKCGGLRGCGVLVVRDATARLRPLLHGGGQESGLRPGTQSPALCAATALCIELALREQPTRAVTMAAARDAFVAALAASAADVQLLTPMHDSLPNTVMLRARDVDGRTLLPALDLAGIEASHGSACSAGSPTPPSVLAAMAIVDRDARACVRFSFARDARRDDATRAGEVAAVTIARLQKKT